MFNFFSRCREQNNCKEHIETLKKDVKIDTLPYFSETIDPYISIYEGALSKELCDNIINFYNKNKDLQYNGRTMGGVENNVKKTTDMSITDGIKNNDELRGLDMILKENLTMYVEQYSAKIADTVKNAYLIGGGGVDTGYQIQVYKRNEGIYRPHTDDNSRILANKIYSRVITFIWYLNDVEDAAANS